jgi:hypothetical protein
MFVPDWPIVGLVILRGEPTQFAGVFTYEF